MWHFARRRKLVPADPLTVEVDLAPLAPFAEVDRYLLGYGVNGGVHRGLGVVYEARSGERVHVFHSPGPDHGGGGMENFVENIATQIRHYDPQAIALFTAWPSDTVLISPARLIRHVLAPDDGTIPGRGVVAVNEDGTFTNLTRPSDCLYARSSFAPRPLTEELSALLGTPVARFTTSEWDAAADLIDPDGSVRDSIQRRDDEAWGNQRAILQEWDAWEVERDKRDDD